MQKDLVIFCGDLTDKGDVVSYKMLKSRLNDLNMPYKLLLGNHDNRENFLTVFGEEQVDEKMFLNLFVVMFIAQSQDIIKVFRLQFSKVQSGKCLCFLIRWIFIWKSMNLHLTVLYLLRRIACLYRAKILSFRI